MKATYLAHARAETAIAQRGYAELAPYLRPKIIAIKQEIEVTDKRQDQDVGLDKIELRIMEALEAETKRIN